MIRGGSVKRKLFHRGKTFYAILRLLVVFINVPILLALLFTQRTLNRSHETLEAMLSAAQETQIQYVQEANPARNHTDQLLALQQHALLQELGKEETLTYGPDLKAAEDILLSVSPAYSDYGQITTYLYFVKSGYLIDSSRPGGNAAEDANARIFSGFNDPNGFTGVPRVYFYGAASPEDEAHSIYTASVFPGVIFIFDIYFPEYPVSSRPDLSLSEEFTANLKDVETCYYDSYGNVRVTGGEPNLIRLYDYDSLGPDENGSFSFRHGGHFYLCHYVFNEHNTTKFATFFRDEIAEEQHKTSILIWVSGCVLLIALLAFAFLYTRRTYRPIGSLVNRISQNKTDGHPLPEDEFQVLNAAIDSFDDRLSKRDHLLGKYYLLRLLRGQKVDTLEDYQDDWFSDESDRVFAVAALRVDEFQGGELYDESLLENAVVSFLRSKGWDIRTVADSDFLYIVFRLPSGAGGDKLLQAFRRLQEQLKEYYISVYVSDIHTSIRELRRCCGEALTVSEYYIANETINIVANSASTPKYSPVRGTASPDFSLLRKLSDCVTSLSAEDALAAFDELTAQLRTGERPLDRESPVYSLLVSTVALAVYDVDLPGEAGKALVPQYINQIRTSSDVPQLRLRLQECLHALSKRSDGQEYYLQRFEKIRDHIQAHYSDPNLDAASIAEHYGMSPSTITRLFRKYNDTGFLEYVHQTRVRKAIELLQGTDLPVSEISALVGYTNAATMNRAFKAHANATPSVIRKRAQEDGGR